MSRPATIDQTTDVVVLGGRDAVEYRSRPDRDALAKLREPFKPEQIGKLPKGGAQLDYVGHAVVTARLLDVDPEWSWEPLAFVDGLPAVRVVGEEATLWIRLTICGVTRTGVGSCKANTFERDKQLIGDALRNAAMRFGVALDLWSKEELHPIEQAQPDPEWEAHKARVKALSQRVKDQNRTDEVKALGLEWPWTADGCDQIDKLLDEIGSKVPELDEERPF